MLCLGRKLGEEGGKGKEMAGKRGLHREGGTMVDWRLKEKTLGGGRGRVSLCSFSLRALSFF